MGSFRSRKKPSYVALEASGWVPEPREGDCTCVGRRELGVGGAVEEGQLGQLPWPRTPSSPNRDGNKGLDQVT